MIEKTVSKAGRWGRPKTAGLVLLVLCMIAACQQAPPPPSMPPASILAGQVLQKDMAVEINAIGTVEAVKSVTVYPRVGGEVVQVHFQQGQDVRKGQLLFTLDSEPYREKLHQAEGKLARDRAQMAFNEEEAKRYAFLHEKGAVSKSEADRYRTEASIYEALVKADLAEVAEARLNLGYCSVQAPFDGRTGAYGINAGTVVKANETVLVTLNAMTPIHVRFTVPEKELPRIKRYQATGPLRVVATPSGDFSGDVRTGRLFFLDNTVDAATGAIQLKAIFENGDRFLWPGQFVKVKLYLTVQKDALVCPVRAVQTVEEGMFVYVVKADKTAEMRPVVVDRTVEGEAVIGKGLAAGETVVTDGHLKIYPGGKVGIWDKSRDAGATARPEGAKK